jgi:type I restriction enzyme, S subunit
MTKPMNKIEKLIDEMCPQGVEFRALGEVGKVSMCKRIFKN